MAWRFAAAYGKPCSHLASVVIGAKAGRLLADFAAEHRLRVLNIVGERACRWPGIIRFVILALEGFRDGGTGMAERCVRSIGVHLSQS